MFYDSAGKLLLCLEGLDQEARRSLLGVRSRKSILSEVESSVWEARLAQITALPRGMRWTAANDLNEDLLANMRWVAAGRPRDAPGFEYLSEPQRIGIPVRIRAGKAAQEKAIEFEAAELRRAQLTNQVQANDGPTTPAARLEHLNLLEDQHKLWTASPRSKEVMLDEIQLALLQSYLEIESHFGVPWDEDTDWDWDESRRLQCSIRDKKYDLTAPLWLEMSELSEKARL